MLKLSGTLERSILAALIFFALFFSVSGSSQQSYRLSYRWLTGQRLQYSTYIIGQMTTSQGTQDIRIQYTDLWEVAGEDKVHGLYKVTEKCLDYSGISFDLRSFGLTSEGEQVERMMDPYGRVASVVHYTEGSRYYLLPLVLPQVPVKLEGKWKLTQEARVPLFEREVTAQVVIVYTFEEINRNYKGRGRDCARIRVDANYLYEPAGEESGVKGAYQGRIFFDLQEQRLVDYQITENRREWSKSENRTRSTSLQITSIAHQ